MSDSYIEMLIMDNNIIANKLIVKGRVQGVGFRYFTHKIATICNIVGYVKNRYNGDVEIIACGKENDLNKFIQKIHTGPPLAVVTDFIITKISLNPSYEKFEIKY